MKKDNFRGLARKIALFSLIAFSTPVFSIGFSYLDQGGVEQVSSRSSYRRLNVPGGAFGVFPAAFDKSRQIMGLLVVSEPQLRVARRCNILFLGIKNGEAIGLTTKDCVLLNDGNSQEYATVNWNSRVKFFIPNYRSSNLVIKAKDTITYERDVNPFGIPFVFPIEDLTFFDWSNRPTDAMLDYSKEVRIGSLGDADTPNRLVLIYGEAEHPEESLPDTQTLNVHLGPSVLPATTYSYLSWGDQPVRVNWMSGNIPHSAIVGDASNPGYKFLSTIPVVQPPNTPDIANNYQELRCYGDAGGVVAAQVNPLSGAVDGILAVIFDSVNGLTLTPGGLCSPLNTAIPLSNEDIRRIVYFSRMPNHP